MPTIDKHVPYHKWWADNTGAFRLFLLLELSVGSGSGLAGTFVDGFAVTLIQTLKQDGDEEDEAHKLSAHGEEEGIFRSLQEIQNLVGECWAKI